MKLLPKRQITLVVAQERKQHIDEGVAIARKVDALRESLATLEKQHKDFLEQISLESQTKRDEAQAKLDQLQREIGDLTESRQKLLEPLDKEWERVTAVRELNEQEKREIAVDRLVLQQAQSILEDRKKEVDESQRSALFTIEQSEIAIKQFHTERDWFDKESKAIEQQRRELRSEITISGAQHEVWQQETTERENKIQFDLEHIEQRTKELDDRDREVKDRYEQLLKTEQEVYARKINRKQ